MSKRFYSILRVNDFTETKDFKFHFLSPEGRSFHITYEKKEIKEWREWIIKIICSDLCRKSGILQNTSYIHVNGTIEDPTEESNYPRPGYTTSDAYLSRLELTNPKTGMNMEFYLSKFTPPYSSVFIKLPSKSGELKSIFMKDSQFYFVFFTPNGQKTEVFMFLPDIYRRRNDPLKFFTKYPLLMNLLCDFHKELLSSSFSTLAMMSRLIEFIGKESDFIVISHNEKVIGKLAYREIIATKKTENCEIQMQIDATDFYKPITLGHFKNEHLSFTYNLENGKLTPEKQLNLADIDKVAIAKIENFKKIVCDFYNPYPSQEDIENLMCQEYYNRLLEEY